MNVANGPDWVTIRKKAEAFGPGAVQFVRDGLSHTARALHGESSSDDKSRHVSGQQLCMGLRDLALQRYGYLARTVLYRWHFRRTEDFGVIVFALIDKGEMRCADDDRFEDFQGVYDFDEVFGEGVRV